MPRNCRSFSSPATSRSPPTSDFSLDPRASALIQGLREQPLLLVLRPSRPAELLPLLPALARQGLQHIEIAWSDHPDWVADCRRIRREFPSLRPGAASVCTPRALADAAEAGFAYAVSPILDRSLLVQSRRMPLLLVPGVLTPTEVHRARSWGCPVVKLFPAAAVGPAYWSGLRGPLGDPLPFCIAAGGLGPADLDAWLDAGVDAVAMGSSLVASGRNLGLDPDRLADVLACLSRS